MKARDLAMAAVLMLGIGFCALLFFAPLAKATEVEPTPLSPRTHQLTVCQPSQDCEKRGRPMGATACSLDAASERLLAGLPSGTLVSCVRLPVAK